MVQNIENNQKSKTQMSLTTLFRKVRNGYSRFSYRFRLVDIKVTYEPLKLPPHEAADSALISLSPTPPFYIGTLIKGHGLYVSHQNSLVRMHRLAKTDTMRGDTNQYGVNPLWTRKCHHWISSTGMVADGIDCHLLFITT